MPSAALIVCGGVSMGHDELAKKPLCLYKGQYLSANLDVFLCCAFDGHRRCRMVSAQLLNKRPGPFLRVGLQLGHLIWVLKQCHDPLFGHVSNLLFMCNMGKRMLPHQSNHVDHGGVASYKKQECHLHSVGHLEVACLDMLRNQLADQVVLGLLKALVAELAKITDELTVSQLLALRQSGQCKPRGVGPHGCNPLCCSGSFTSRRTPVGSDGVLLGQELEILERDAENRVDDLMRRSQYAHQYDERIKMLEYVRRMELARRNVPQSPPGHQRSPSPSNDQASH